MKKMNIILQTKKKANNKPHIRLVSYSGTILKIENRGILVAPRMD